MIAMDKHYSLLQTFVNYGRKCFTKLKHGVNVMKLFMTINYEY
jgi:hypothetical protein